MTTPGDLLQMTDRLWRAPTQVTFARHGALNGRKGREFLVLPTRNRPRLLVPAGAPHAAAAALRHRGRHLGIKQRAVRQLLWMGLWLGIAQRLLRDRVVVSSTDNQQALHELDEHVRSFFGSDAVISVQVGPLRANRKPVLEVLDRAGRTLGFVKVGWNELTRSLVAGETQTLREFAGHPAPGVRSPEVLFAGSWTDLELLGLSPLPRRGLPTRRSQVPLEAMRAVAHSKGVETCAFAQSTYWAGWRRWLATRAQDTGSPIPSDLESRISVTVGVCDIAFGSWHGDWTPWNMTWRRDAVHLWDWERFSTGVPVGFDVAHYCVQSRRREGQPARQAVAEGLAHADRLLPAVGVPADQVTAVSLLYLVEILRRYDDDSRLDTGGALQPMLQAVLAELDLRTCRHAEPTVPVQRSFR